MVVVRPCLRRAAPADGGPTTNQELLMNPSNVRRTVVVAAASRHGSTGRDRRPCGGPPARSAAGHWSICRSDPGNTWSLTDADAVVLGSGIYFGRWLRPARRALERIDDHEHVWLFSSGPIGASGETDSQPSSAGLRTTPTPCSGLSEPVAADTPRTPCHPSAAGRRQRQPRLGRHRPVGRRHRRRADPHLRFSPPPEAHADRADLHTTGARP